MAVRATKNAFTYYVEEYHDEQIAAGRKITRKQAVDECSLGWGDLDPDTRLKYCNMANPMLDLAGKPLAKTPPNMEWLDPVTGEYGEKWLRYVRAGDELYYLKNAIVSRKKLKMFSFYLVHFNYFCKPSAKKYVPAELALVEFNLTEGIKNVYHTLINPGSIPLGFAHEAKRLSQEGHGIPVPPHARGEKDPAKIVEAVKRFLMFGTGPTGKFPPLFTVTDNILPAMHMLNDMVPYNEDQPVFIVYPVHRMFHWIRNKCSAISGKGAGFLDESYALKEIERDCFRYIVEIACDFHKQSESCFPMCSQSIVKRLAFTICDHCCRDLNIPLVGGKHVHRRGREPSAGENSQKGKKEDEDYQMEEEDSDEAREVPDFVGCYSTRQLPKDGLARLSTGQMKQFYQAFLHNAMEGKVVHGFSDEVVKDEMYMRNTDPGELAPDNPFGSSSSSDRLLTSGEEVAAYRQYEARKNRNLVFARVKAREARESRETFENRTEEDMEARAEGQETRLDPEGEQ